jgi:peptide/nickel transport system permease protein
VSLTADEASQMSDADLAKKRAELGLDRPAVVRYFDWLAHAARGDFGKTIIARRTWRR